VLQAMAYSRGAYTVVYPVVRGTGPLFTVIGAWLLFGETFNAAMGRRRVLVAASTGWRSTTCAPSP
jgi:multidrug transporter EmrE-like cation transporter